MEPLFSIVIPVYNVENYLDECVRSILTQIDESTPPIETILVDDGSTDRSGIICDNYARECKNIIVVHQKNQGLLAARRSGFRVASGQYIISIDSDDFLIDGAILSLTKIISKVNADVIFYNISVMSDAGTKPYYKDVFTRESGCFITKEQVLEAYFNFDIPVVTSMAGKAIRRSCFDLKCDYTSFGKLSMGEDTLQTAEVVSRANCFYYLNENLYIYRMGSGMTSKFDPEYYVAFKRIISTVKNRLGIANDKKYAKVYAEKILSSGCRAITQSKVADMTYSERKRYIKSIFEDDVFKAALSEVNFGSANIKRKYKFIIGLGKAHAYFFMHIALRLMS